MQLPSEVENEESKPSIGWEALRPSLLGMKNSVPARTTTFSKSASLVQTCVCNVKYTVSKHAKGRPRPALSLSPVSISVHVCPRHLHSRWASFQPPYLSTGSSPISAFPTWKFELW